MIARRVLNKSQVARYEAEQGILVEAGECGVSARHIDPYEAYQIARDEMVEARDLLEGTRNPLARLFAKRRHAEALAKVAGFMRTKKLLTEF